MRRIGNDFKNKAGDLVSPVVFIHPCWMPGCKAYAAHGFRVDLLKKPPAPGFWSCADHVNELETILRDNPPSLTDGGPDASSKGNRDLFGG